MSEVRYTRIGDLEVHPILEKTVRTEICAGSEISENHFWQTLETVLKEFSPKNEALLKKRDALQSLIDAFHLERSGQSWDAAEYISFLANIGYIVPEGPEFKIDTENVDAEIASIAGPQLVVPVDKPRFALNAANARWGSLMDAFYGTDAGPPEDPGFEKGKGYNPKRGERVFEYTFKFLDEFFTLSKGSFSQVKKFQLKENELIFNIAGEDIKLLQPEKFVAYTKEGAELKSILFKNNDLHVEIKINPKGNIGKTQQAGIDDVLVESAITAICDMEDSVAAVDAFDKSVIYTNWARLMKNTLEEKFLKGEKEVHRKLNEDKEFIGVDGKTLKLPGRVVLLVRNVGLHMYTEMIRFSSTQQPVPEGLVDLVVTAVAALHDIGLNANKKNCFNSRTGSVYIVKPKQHGPEEVNFTVDCFERTEELLGMKKNCLKIGIMDEERRTTVNLKECIRMAKNRCIFINTGFMDRTGDEFHTSMQRGSFLPKTEVKKAVWLQAYENWNVEMGIRCGLNGRAQIGKGMWAAPDSMKDMLEKKISHPQAGATCAWVPSPTAATLHAIHYHKVNVKYVLETLKKKGKFSSLSDILTPPLVELYGNNFKLTKEVALKELENNAQSILGYVVRWVIMGVGCSKVPDITDEPLMEDRATLRINSQHIANWLLHGVITEKQVLDTFKKMAEIVDKQNKGQEKEGYKKMTGNFETNNGFLCALELVFNGLQVPNGLTEYSLTKFRQEEKKRAAKL